MTISTTASRIAYTGNGVTTAFSFPNRFFANTDLVVVKVSTLGVETTLTLTTDYTVTGADLDAGGTVTCVVAPAVGERLVIYRDMDYTQEVDYTSGDSFPAETHERALDRLTMQNQQLKDAVDRSVKVSETSTITPDELVDSINDAVIASAASATAADASADAAALSATAADASADAAAASAASIDPASLLTKAGNLSGLTSATTARSNLGLVIGTDVLAPSGSGASLTGMLYLGVGQTSQDLTASRALGTTYTNSTGKPIFVSVRGVSPSGSTAGVELVIGGVTQPYSSIASSNPTITCGIVPNGTTYSCNANGCTLGKWVELR